MSEGPRSDEAVTSTLPASSGHERLDEELREAGILASDIVETIHEPLIVLTPDLRVRVVNPAFYRKFGVQPKETTGSLIYDLGNGQWDIPALRTLLEQILPENDSFEGYEITHEFEGLGQRTMLLNARRLDPLQLILLAIADITEPKRLAERLRQAQKMEAVGRLAGGIAHDFNNLLTTVEGRASILLEDLPIHSPFREDVGQILKAGQRAADLTSQLLTFSRQQVVEERKVDLRTVAVEMEKLLRRLVPARIRFQVGISEESTIVRADPGQLHQLLMSLVVNAVDAIEDKGAITIEVEPSELTESNTQDFPGEVEPGQYVHLCVRDTGTGMPPEVLKDIFDPFFTTKGPGPKTGLGLATVFGIVQQGRGHIIAESEPGRGSRFRVFFPRVAAVREPVKQRPLPGSEVRRATVLVVEDDDSVRALICRILVRSGFDVLEATNGLEALDLVEESIDLVISDVMMPVMGGVDLTKRLAERYPELKVILTSGYSEAEISRDIRQLGGPFLSKPFSPQALIRCVAEVLGGASEGG